MTPDSRPIRLLLVDDQQLIRQGIETLLEIEPDLLVVGYASTRLEAIEAVERLAPDVVLMDIRMPEMDGVAATRTLTARHPELAIIILTTFDDDEYVFEGLKAGARGYLLKDVSSEELAATIRTVADGGALIQPSITRKVVAEFGRLAAGARDAEPAAEPLLEPLTEREEEVLAELARGLSNREIAARLFITEGTVKNHVSNLIGKLGVRDRTQAVLEAQRRGLVE